MKKMINTAFVYMILGLAAGVFYREYTKLSGFEGLTVLKGLHPHLLALGMGMFLILALFVKALPGLQQEKSFGWFYGLYNAGLAGSVIMMIVRGILQVQGTMLSADMNAAVSGIAGVCHIVLAIGLFCLFAGLRKCAGKIRD